MPSPEAAETGKTRRPRSRSSSTTKSEMSRPSGTSILLSATSRGRSSRPPYRASSFSMMSRSSTGLRPGSRVAVSMTWTSAAQRSMWRRKSWPRPRPSLAPSIRPGHVGDRERRVAGGDHTEVGHQRGERVVGDLGARPRDRGDQAGLAGAGEADEADVGDHLELEDDLELVAGLAEQREAGGLALGGGQRRVAEAAAAALGDDQLGARSDHVGQHVAGAVGDHGAVRDRQDQVGAVGAVAVAAGTVAAVLAAPLRAVVVVDQRGDVGVDPQDHRATGAAVAAVGATERLELLAVHRGDAVAASAGADVQRHPVDEGRDCHGFNRRSLIGKLSDCREMTKGAPSLGTPFGGSCQGERQVTRPGGC